MNHCMNISPDFPEAAYGNTDRLHRWIKMGERVQELRRKRKDAILKARKTVGDEERRG